MVSAPNMQGQKKKEMRMTAMSEGLALTFQGAIYVVSGGDSQGIPTNPFMPLFQH